MAKSVTDKARQQILRLTPRVPFPLTFPLSDLLICEFNQGEAVVSREIILTSCSENVTQQITCSSSRPDDIRLRGLVRLLRQVIARKPIAHRPYEQAPDYIICSVVETLECGHKLEFSFLDEAEPLTARRRVCHECSGRIGSLPLDRKKPVQSVRPDTKKEIACIKS